MNVNFVLKMMPLALGGACLVGNTLLNQRYVEALKEKPLYHGTTLERGPQDRSFYVREFFYVTSSFEEAEKYAKGQIASATRLSKERVKQQDPVVLRVSSSSDLVKNWIGKSVYFPEGSRVRIEETFSIVMSAQDYLELQKIKKIIEPC